jgi:FkbM family methyltransferase
MRDVHPNPEKNLTPSSAIWKVIDACLPKRSNLLHRIGRKLTQRHLGEGDDDMNKNGELLVAKTLLRDSPGDVVDVGANVGEWSNSILAMRPLARIHMFEPVGGTFAKLTSSSWPPGTILTKAAVGEEVGQATLLTGQDFAGSNSIYRRTGVQVKIASEEIVPCITLDEYCREKSIQSLAYVKIDVEGHELAVIRGAASLLRAEKIDAIQFEYGGTFIDARILLKDIFDFIYATNPNYHLCKIHRSGLIRANGYSQSYENFQYANWLIIHQDILARNTIAPLLLK